MLRKNVEQDVGLVQIQARSQGGGSGCGNS